MAYRPYGQPCCPGTFWPTWSIQAASRRAIASGSWALAGASSATAPSGRHAAAFKTIMPAGSRSPTLHHAGCGMQYWQSVGIHHEDHGCLSNACWYYRGELLTATYIGSGQPAHCFRPPTFSLSSSPANQQWGKFVRQCCCAFADTTCLDSHSSCLREIPDQQN